MIIRSLEPTNEFQRRIATSALLHPDVLMGIFLAFNDRGKGSTPRQLCGFANRIYVYCKHNPIDWQMFKIWCEFMFNLGIEVEVVDGLEGKHPGYVRVLKSKTDIDQLIGGNRKGSPRNSKKIMMPIAPKQPSARLSFTRNP